MFVLLVSVCLFDGVFARRYKWCYVMIVGVVVAVVTIALVGGIFC